MTSASSLQFLLIAICSVLCCKTSALPAIATYSAMSRSGTLDGDGEGAWTSEPPQDLEMYKLLYEVSNTVERPRRHADGLFTSGYSKLLGQLSAKEYLESLLKKRVSDELGADQIRSKRHSDAVFTDNYSRYRQQMAVKKYLDSVLAGKRSEITFCFLTWCLIATEAQETLYLYLTSRKSLSLPHSRAMKTLSSIFFNVSL